MITLYRLHDDGRLRGEHIVLPDSEPDHESEPGAGQSSNHPRLADSHEEAHELHTAQLASDELAPPILVRSDVLWIDLCQPDEQEQRWVSEQFTVVLPELEEIEEIESSSRFYLAGDGIHLVSLFPHRRGREPQTVNIAFHLHGRQLISVRYEDIGLLRLFRNHLRRQRLSPEDGWEVLLALLAMKIDYLADEVEDVYRALEVLGQQAVRPQALEDTLHGILLQERYNDKVRQSLLDSQRLLRQLTRHLPASPRHKSRRQEIRDMLRDIDSLNPHTTFIFEKVNFLLDASIGFTNLDQSRIIKIFSVAAVVFMPPTLIASIYGMNFQWMPELDKDWGYPFALVLMAASALSTYLFFKWKKWL